MFLWCIYCVFVLCMRMTSCFDSDAGLVTSYTKKDSTVVTSSSSPTDAYLANDGDPATHWMSAGCMPGGFYANNSLQNVLKRACDVGMCSFVPNDVTGTPPLSPMTDGDTSYTSVHIPHAFNITSIEVKVVHPQPIKYLTIRGRYSGSMSVKLFDENYHVAEEFVLNATDNYSLKDFKVSSHAVVETVRLDFDSDVTIWELAALGQDGCLDEVTWDLGMTSSVRVIKSRHWAGQHGLETFLFVSNDGRAWNLTSQLDPAAVGTVTTILKSAVNIRYIKIQQRYTDTKWAKVYMWELDAYDEHSEFGPRPPAKVNPTSLRNMLGVNGIWGWGHSTYSDLLAKGQGPDLYAPVASHARNYHNMNWDVTDPDLRANYSGMAAGRGTQAQSWLDWDQEYRAWGRSGLTVHTAVQFTRDMFPEGVWDTVKNSSYQYGKDFSRHFGPTHGVSRVAAAEVGNEPWTFPASFYRDVLASMAAGLKIGDPKMMVLPAAFQAESKESEGSYIGTHVTSSALANIDAVNYHHYSYYTGGDGVRRATFPENLASSFNGLRNIIRWRDANCPDKPVWVTEWGWDSPGAGQLCHFPECVSEDAAAVYAKRGLLLHARHGIERSTYFFYANDDSCNNHIYCRSGLTGSHKADFAKKKPFYSLEHVMNIMGGTHFIKVIQEDDQGYIYEFGLNMTDDSYVTTHIVLWQPVEHVDGLVTHSTVTFKHQSVFLEAMCEISGTVNHCDNRVVVDYVTSVWAVKVTPDPIILSVKSPSSSSGLVG